MAALDFFVTMRSPYSYLAADRVVALAERAGVELHLRPVYPIALRDPGFFEKADPAKLAYLRRDAERVAAMEGIAFGWPDPDPVVQDLDSGKVADDQPHIRHLSHLVAAACLTGQGVAVYLTLAGLLFAGGPGWAEPGRLDAALASCGLDPAQFRNQAAVLAPDCEALLQTNADALRAAGHWGTPSLGYRGEVFFGQDRIDMCAWFMGLRSVRPSPGG